MGYFDSKLSEMFTNILHEFLEIKRIEEIKLK